MKIQKKALSTLVLRILLPIQIQLYALENPKIQKIDSPSCTVRKADDDFMFIEGM
jgi:hypothetical protein